MCEPALDRLVCYVRHQSRRSLVASAKEDSASPGHIMSSLAPLVGGALIGLAASLLWVSHGRVAGISGLTAAVATGQSPGARSARDIVPVAFVVGLLLAGFAVRVVAPGAIGAPSVGLGAIAVAGLAVGFGTRLGGGCTSGHGVCGVSRISKRSLVATATFMAVGMLTTWAVARTGAP
ncbi:MAG: YeeE/YedE family protein [Polyangiaceae bacterium]